MPYVITQKLKGEKNYFCGLSSGTSQKPLAELIWKPALKIPKKAQRFDTEDDAYQHVKIVCPTRLRYIKIEEVEE